MTFSQRLLQNEPEIASGGPLDTVFDIDESIFAKAESDVAATIRTSDLIDIEVDGVDTKDYPDFCDAFISSAKWASTGEELTEAERDRIDSGDVYEAVIDQLY